MARRVDRTRAKLLRWLRRLVRGISHERVDAELGLRRLVERRISQEIALRCASDRAPVFDDIESARRRCASPTWTPTSTPRPTRSCARSSRASKRAR